MKKLHVQAMLLASLAALPLVAAAEELRRAPGSSLDAAGGWQIGTEHVDGGYRIYHWDGKEWALTSGVAVEIGGSYFNPWAINERGERLTWTGKYWQLDVRYSPRWRRERDERDHHEQKHNHDDDRDDDSDKLGYH